MPPRLATILLCALGAPLLALLAARPARADDVCLSGFRYTPALVSTFATDRWQNAKGGVWFTAFPWGRSNPTGGDAAYYLDPSSSDYDPFGTSAGGRLTISAEPAPEDLRARFGFGYLSGVIATARAQGSPTFVQRFGYFELRARLPRGAGLWPAFWLRDNRGGTAEIDVFEFLGDDTSTIYQSVHYVDGTGATYRYHPVFDPTAGFHDYGVLVAPGNDTFFVDGSPTHSVRDPSTGPLYVIVSMQVGAKHSWPGPPDATTRWPAVLSLESFRALAPAGTPCGA